MSARRKRRINWRVVLYNLAEAREELERLEEFAARPSARSEGGLNVGLGHAYHHLNFAWNARNFSMARYRKCTASDFRKMSQWPRGVWVVGSDPPRSRKRPKR